MEREALEIVNIHYENWMFGKHDLAFDKIGFFNYGYWKGIEKSIEFAQINLIETLIEFLVNKRGNVLDVACGKGASTKFLTKYFDAGKIIGINVSPRQLDTCRMIAPECDFRLMDATNLEFPDESFDNILSIEAGIHFVPRRKFFEEAHRVLRPGGRIAMSDVLYDHVLSAVSPSHPKENYLPNLDAYVALISDIGFRHYRVEDTTPYVRDAYCRYLMRYLERKLDENMNDELVKAIAECRELEAHFTAACMIYLIK